MWVLNSRANRIPNATVNQSEKLAPEFRFRCTVIRLSVIDLSPAKPNPNLPSSLATNLVSANTNLGCVVRVGGRTALETKSLRDCPKEKRIVIVELEMKKNY